MEKFKVSEIFYSAQGEGRYVGVPSVFFRTFGCNFKCPGFGLPPGVKTTEPDEIAQQVKENPNLYTEFNSLPLATTGCDSYASWHPGFKKFSPVYSIDEAVEAMLKLTPEQTWTQKNGNSVHLVITGGEPLLGWQRLFPKLLDAERMHNLSHLTFETNGTQKLTKEMKMFLANRSFLETTFSVSPKLSASGEAWEDAVKPAVVAEYQDYGHVYLKFVVESDEHIDEVDRAVAEYRRHDFKGDVYLMPVGGTDQAYFANNKHVADAALARGYRYSPRLHVDIWKNGWGK
jgi:7-carboxy-7-deazaguanine synthase